MSRRRPGQGRPARWRARSRPAACTGPAEVAIEPRPANHCRTAAAACDGPRRESFSLEQDDQGVPGKDQDVAVAGLQLTDKGGQDRADQAGHLLRAGPAPTGQPLGQASEAGNVGEQEGALDPPVRRQRIGGQPLGRDARHVRLRVTSRRVGSVRSGAFPHRYLVPHRCSVAKLTSGARKHRWTTSARARTVPGPATGADRSETCVGRNAAERQPLTIVSAAVWCRGLEDRSSWRLAACSRAPLSWSSRACWRPFRPEPVAAVVAPQVVRADASGVRHVGRRLQWGLSVRGRPGGRRQPGGPSGRRPAAGQPGSGLGHGNRRYGGNPGRGDSPVVPDRVDPGHDAVDSLGLENLPVQIPLSTIPFSRSTSPKSWQDLLSYDRTQRRAPPECDLDPADPAVPRPVRPGLDRHGATWIGRAASWPTCLSPRSPSAGPTSPRSRSPCSRASRARIRSAAERWCYALNQAQADSCPNPPAWAASRCSA